MSTNRKLGITFAKANGDKFTQSYNHVDPEVTGVKVRNFAQLLISCGSIFDKVPASVKSAKITTTTETAVDLS